jgi:hypothetical protein
MAMAHYTLSDCDTSVDSFGSWLNRCIGKPHPDCPDRIVTGVVSAQFVVIPSWDHDYQRTLYRVDAFAIVDTDTAVEIG